MAAGQGFRLFPALVILIAGAAMVCCTLAPPMAIAHGQPVVANLNAEHAPDAPWLGVSFVILVGQQGFPAYPHWNKFFATCGNDTKATALIFEHGTPGSVGNRTCSERRTPWAKCGTFAYPPGSLRFSVSMVRLMHAGVMQSPVGSTVAFISDTSVPMRTCSATVAAVQGKVLLGNVGLYMTGRSTKSSAEKGDLYMCKASQWMSLPRQVWLDHYDSHTLHLRWKSRRHTHIAPDEWWMQTELCLNKTLSPPFPSNRIDTSQLTHETQVARLVFEIEKHATPDDVHHLVGPMLSPAPLHKSIWGRRGGASNYGHASVFTDQHFKHAQRNGYLFIRKLNTTDTATKASEVSLAEDIPKLPVMRAKWERLPTTSI